MAEPVLKFPAARQGTRNREIAEGAVVADAACAAGGAAAIVAVAGVAFYLSGGRYVSTDNAYIGAQKVLITPSVSGTIKRVLVRKASTSTPATIVRDRS